MSGENLWDKLMDREDKKHIKQIESKLPQLHDDQIYESFPSSDIIQDQQAIKVLKDKTGLEDNEIVTSINRLIQGRRIVSSYDAKQRLWLRKNNFA